jgi:hypothetical protein
MVRLVTPVFGWIMRRSVVLPSAEAHFGQQINNPNGLDAKFLLDLSFSRYVLCSCEVAVALLFTIGINPGAVGSSQAASRTQIF